MLSTFGKFIRNLRMDRNELLKDMADNLGVTSSYLSAIELGKRSVPSVWLDKIISLYELPYDKAKELEQAIDDSLFEVKVDLKGRNNEDKDLIISFARNLDNLDQESKRKILEMIKL